MNFYEDMNINPFFLLTENTLLKHMAELHCQSLMKDGSIYMRLMSIASPEQPAQKEFGNGSAQRAMWFFANLHFCCTAQKKHVKHRKRLKNLAFLHVLR